MFGGLLFRLGFWRRIPLVPVLGVDEFLLPVLEVGVRVRESGTVPSCDGVAPCKPDPIGCDFPGPVEGTNGPGRGLSVGGHSRNTGDTQCHLVRRSVLSHACHDGISLHLVCLGLDPQYLVWYCQAHNELSDPLTLWEKTLYLAKTEKLATAFFRWSFEHLNTTFSQTICG